MGVHRLLQRAFARLYGYHLPKSNSHDGFHQPLEGQGGQVLVSPEDDLSSILTAGNLKDLHYKLKGARPLMLIHFFFIAVL